MMGLFIGIMMSLVISSCAKENQQFDKGFDVHPSPESRFYGLPVRPVIEVKKD